MLRKLPVDLTYRLKNNARVTLTFSLATQDILIDVEMGKEGSG